MPNNTFNDTIPNNNIETANTQDLNFTNVVHDEESMKNDLTNYIIGLDKNNSNTHIQNIPNSSQDSVNTFVKQ